MSRMAPQGGFLDSPALLLQEGAPEPETEREDTRPEANVADEGAPEEPTEDETLTSALAADQPDVSGKSVNIPGGWLFLRLSLKATVGPG